MIPAAHVVFVLDDSGSMRDSAPITKKAFDGMVEALQLCKGADIVMSLIKYGTSPKLVYARKHIQDVEPVEYYPDSSDDTIYDSMLFALKLEKEAPRAEKTIIILQADGGDTCSKAKPYDVKPKVLAAKEKGIEFLFLGAAYYDDHVGYIKHYPDGKIGDKPIPGMSKGIMHCAVSLGFEPQQVMFYNSNAGKESLTAFAETATNIGSVASRLKEHADYTEEQKQRVKKG